jgi:hypothetical protein
MEGEQDRRAENHQHFCPWGKARNVLLACVAAKKNDLIIFSHRSCTTVNFTWEVIMSNLSVFLAKPLCLLLIVSFSLLDLSVQSAQAGMIGTETIMNAGADQKARDRVMEFFGREEVRKALSRQGIDPAEARDRVAGLSGAEIARIDKMMDRLPAGGDAGTVVGIALLVFFVLLITDILGYTNIFGFVRGSGR